MQIHLVMDIRIRLNNMRFVNVVFVVLLLIAGFSVSAQIENITFPINDLGGCESKEACKTYCDEPAHINECISFAEEHKLLPEEDIERVKKFNKLGGVGPGGCDSMISCEAFCSTIAHINECLAFAEDNHFIPEEELEEIRMIHSLVNRGVSFPGGCTSEAECESYCSDVAHIDECFAFAVEAGFVEGEKLDEAKRAFELMQRGETPGGCTDRRACRTYCDSDLHFEECIVFAEKAGFISETEAAVIKKTGGIGPGGCVREECEAYCLDPSNFEVCSAFGREHGLENHDFDQRPEEQQFAPGKRDFSFGSEVIVCLKQELGSDFVEKLMAGQILPTPMVEDVVQKCSEVRHVEEKRETPDYQSLPDDLYKLVPEKYEREYDINFLKENIHEQFLNDFDRRQIEEEIRKKMEHEQREYEYKIEKLPVNE